MKTTTIYGIFSFLLVIVLSIMLTSHSDGPAATVGMGYTGAPNESGMVCADCHNNGGPFGATISVLSETGFFLNYLNSIQFHVNTPANATGYGIQIILLDIDGNPLPMFYSNLSPNLKVTTLPDGRTYIENDGISSSPFFHFDYELVGYELPRPEALYIYAAAVVVDADGTTDGDINTNWGLINVFPAGVVDVIPVTLTDFTATPLPTNIRLDWATETEQDNDYFAVEHSTDGINFTNIKTIAGAGTTDERHTYTYTHTNPVDGDNYYRLRQVDFDGKETFSEVVTAKFISKFEETTVFPQPASSDATIFLISPANEYGTVRVYDINGKLVYSNTTQLVEGENYLNLSCEDWTVGHYVVHIAGARLGEESIHFLKK